MIKLSLLSRYRFLGIFRRVTFEQFSDDKNEQYNKEIIAMIYLVYSCNVAIIRYVHLGTKLLQKQDYETVGRRLNDLTRQLTFSKIIRLH